MKQFNLEEALAGGKVVTRNGEEVTELTRLGASKYPLVGVVGGEIFSWTIKGEFIIGRQEHYNNLFMAPTKRTVWVNLYPISPDVYYFRTESEADKYAGSGRIGDRAWPLEIEE